MAAYLAMVERRAGGTAVSLALLVALSLVMAGWMPAVMAWIQGVAWLAAGGPGYLDPKFIEFFLWAMSAGGATAALFAVAVLPLVEAWSTARSLGSLRQGRVLEEMAAAGLSPREIVDAFAGRALRRTWTALAGPLAVAAAFWLLGGGAADWIVWAAYPAGMAALYYYGALAWFLWVRGGRRPWLEGAAMALLLAGPVMPILLVSFGAALVEGPWFGGFVALVLSAPVVLVQRWLALQGVRPGSTVHRTLGAAVRTVRPLRRRALRGGTPNAILFRDRAPRSGSLGSLLLGWQGLGLASAALILAQGAWLPELSPVPLLFLVGGVAALRALHSSASALFTERQQGTLELLLQTRLDVSDYVGGSIRAAAERGMVDVGLASAAALASALSSGDEAALAVLPFVALGLLALVDSAASWGTMAAADCRERLQPLVVLAGFSLASGLSLGIAAVLVLSLGATAMVVTGSPLCLALAGGLVAPASGAALAALARKSARSTLAHRPGSPGFAA